MKRRTLGLALKNSIKNTFSNFSQLFGMIMLIALLSIILNLIISLNVRVIGAHDNLIHNSNQHQMVLQLDPTDISTVAANNNENIRNKYNNVEVTNNVQAQQLLLNELQEQALDQDIDFVYSRTEGRDFSQTYNDNNEVMTLKSITKTTIQNGDIENTPGVDNIVISDGRMYEDRHEVVLDSTFAKLNNIEIGTIIRFQIDTYGSQYLVSSDLNSGMTNDFKNDLMQIQEEGLVDEYGLYQRQYSNYAWFQVVGLGSSADFMSPILNSNGVLPNRNTEAIVYVSPDAMGLIEINEENQTAANPFINTYKFDISLGRLQVVSQTEQESYYSIKLRNGKNPTKDQIEILNDMFNDLMETIIPVKYFYSIDDSEYRYYSRTSLIESTIDVYTLISGIILFTIFIIVIYVISLITKKQIEKSRGQIGTMKALGYKKRNIIFNFVVTPWITSFIGGFLGYLFSIGIQIALLREFMLYFSLNFTSFSFEWIGFLTTLVLLWGILTLISFFIAWLFLRKSALSLISANKTAKISRFGILLKKWNLRDSFGSKMRTALLIDASGKMMGVGFVVLLSTFFMTISFLAPNILNRYKIMSYNGISYEQLIEYEEPIANNPYTFMKTYNKNSTLNLNGDTNGYNYSLNLGGVTGLPLDAEGNYDIEKIVDAYINGNVSSDFFSPFIKSNGEEPSGSELAYANSRMLAGTNVLLTNAYFKYISEIAMALPITTSSSLTQIAIRIIWYNLAIQWLDRGLFINNLSIAETNEERFNLMQQFYIKYSETVGKTVTKTTELGATDNDTELDKINKLNASDAAKQAAIQLFRTDDYWGNTGVNAGTRVYNSIATVGNIDTTYLSEFKMDENHNIIPTEDFDFAKIIYTEDADIYSKGVTAFSIWYGSIFALRPDLAIIQAGYSRAPYFVQQYNKLSFDNGNYATAFNLVSYDINNDFLGTLLNAKYNDFDFKIYGINDNNKYMNLYNTKGENLNSRLSYTNNNEIIVNQTIAKYLKLKEGDQITLDISQNLLEYDGQFVDLNNWSDSNQRTRMGFSTGDMGGVPTTNGFMQQSSLNPLNSTLSTNNGSVKIYDANSTMANVDSPLANDIRSGIAANNKVINSNTFKVVGIHNGYGTAAAWINNDNANSILGYDDVQNYLWTNQFIPQFQSSANNSEFNSSYTNGYSKIQVTDYDINNFQTLDAFKNYYFSNDSVATEYNKNIAQNILVLFNSANPVFNYKYSQDLSIADLDTTLSVWTPSGDYTPITMNGDGINIDGIGQSPLGVIYPVEMSKQIIDQIAQVIMAVLILLIILILVVTFVIILLTTSLIISDNSRFIATMKVLGYTDSYIAKNMLGMYLIVIVITFAIGFIGAWFLLNYIVGTALVSSGLVMPYAFTWWLLPAVMLAVIGIYAVTIGVGFRSITKLNAIKILQAENV